MTLPLLETLKHYRWQDFPHDLSAGIIVAVMLIPQAMAYALLAGLPPVVGLYASTFPLIVYALLGSSRHLAVGPVAIVSLLTLSSLTPLAATGTAEYLGLAALLALMIGIIQLLLGVLRAGFLVNFISHAVISGFTSAAAIIIGLSQLKHLLGIDLPRSHNVVISLWHLLQRLNEVQGITLLLGLASIGLLLGLRRWLPRLPAPLLVVTLATLVVYLGQLPARGVSIVGEVPAGLAGFKLPSLAWSGWQALVGAALTISLVSFMESIAVAKSLANKAGYRVHANQEFIALGLANLVGGMFQGYPVTGGFSRSAVNYQAGARSSLASLISAGLIILTLLCFTQLFYFLPKAVLAAIVLVAVYGLIDFVEVRHLFAIKRRDGWTWLLTFAGTLLLGVEQGILLGVGFSLLMFIWRSAYPHTAELGYLAEAQVFRNVVRYPQAQRYANTLIVRPDASLYFANLRFLEDWLESHLQPETHYLLLDFSGVNDMDAVAVEGLKRLLESLQTRGIESHLCAVKGPVRDLLSRAGWMQHPLLETRSQHLSVQHALDTLKLRPN